MDACPLFLDACPLFLEERKGRDKVAGALAEADGDVTAAPIKEGIDGETTASACEGGGGGTTSPSRISVGQSRCGDGAIDPTMIAQ